MRARSAGCARVDWPEHVDSSWKKRAELMHVWEVAGGMGRHGVEVEGWRGVDGHDAMVVRRMVPEDRRRVYGSVGARKVRVKLGMEGGRE